MSSSSARRFSACYPSASMRSTSTALTAPPAHCADARSTPRTPPRSPTPLALASCSPPNGTTTAASSSSSFSSSGKRTSPPPCGVAFGRRRRPRHAKETIKGDKFFHKVKHKIIVSDVVFKGRWSALSSSDLLSLDCNMLKFTSSDRFTAAKEMKSVEDDGDEKTLLEIKVNRSMSEITYLSRLSEQRDTQRGEKDEMLGRLWLPIARQTVQCFVGRTDSILNTEARKNSAIHSTHLS
ncbi:hypothetical protein Cni_G18977 [Canna indica]|uniref:Uncharacterized protein n=1 Tax=Canna indica TaxID=4628 RepID=A0AAQ3KNN0_9LILI|nr:hypothetical protein Cni_G18977 [Canna indica]